MNSLLIALCVQLPPYIIEARGTLRVETPQGQEIVIPEGSRMEANAIGGRLDVKEFFLDNRDIFKSGFES